MFSKAKLKRFNEEIGCGPPPTKYDPKLLTAPLSAGFSVPKSDRFQPVKPAAPGPYYYQAAAPPTPSTPRTMGGSHHTKKIVYSMGSSVRSARTTSTTASIECVSLVSDDSTVAAETSALRTEIEALRAANERLNTEIAQLQQQQQQLCPADSSQQDNGATEHKQLLQRLLQLLTAVEQLDSRLTTAEQLQQQLHSRRHVLHRMDSVCQQLQQMQLVTDQWQAKLVARESVERQLRDTARQQTVRVKELELLVQVARESEVMAHDTCCSLQHRLDTLHGDSAAERHQLQQLQLLHDQLSCRLHAAGDEQRSLSQQLHDAEQESLLMIDRADRLETDVARWRTENAALVERATAAETQLTTSQLEAEQLGSQLLAAQQQLAATGVRLEASETERAELELRVSAVEGHLAAAGQERDELQRQLTASEQQLSAADDRNQQLQSQMWYSALHDRLASEDGELLRQQLADSSRNLQELRDTHSAKQRQLAAWTEHSDRVCRRLAAAAAALADTRARSQSEQLDWRQQLQLAEEQAQRASQLLDERGQLVKLLEQQVAEWREQAVATAGRLYETAARLSAAETACCEKDDCLTLAHARLDSLAEQLAVEKAAGQRLVASEAAARAESASARDELLEMTACADAQIERRFQLEQEGRQLRQRLDADTAALAAKEQLLRHMHDDLQQLAAHRDQLRADSAQLGTQLADKVRDCHQLTDERSQLLSDNASLTASVDTHRQQLAAAGAAVDKLTAELAAASADRCDQLNSLRAQLVQLESERQLAAEQLAEASELTEQWRQQAASAASQQRHIQAALTATQHEQQQLQLKVEQLQSERQQLEQQRDADLASLYKKFDTLRSRLRTALEAERQLEQTREQLQLARTATADGERQLQLLQQQLEQQQQQQPQLVDGCSVNEWKQKYDELLALVGPFQSELVQFQCERDCLLAQRDSTRAEIHQLATQYSQLLGHQNKKQKLHHIMQIKEENLKLKSRVADLEKQVCKQRAQLRQVEQRSSSVGRAGGGGGGAASSSTLFNATMSSRAKCKSSFDCSRSVSDFGELKENMSLLTVTPLRDNCRNIAGNLSPVAATPLSMYKSPRHLEYP